MLLIWSNPNSGIQNSLSVRRAFANKGNDNRRFLNYCLYAFGLPVLIASFVFALDHFTSIPVSFRGLGGAPYQ